MIRMRTLVCSIWFTAVTAAPAAADEVANPPRSLRMRARRVAQATQPDPAPVPTAAPAADAAPPPADPPAADPAPPAPAGDAPPVVVAATPALTDAELAKIAEQEAKIEDVYVTGTNIERKTLISPAPLTIVNRAQLDASGLTTVGDIIQQLPSQANAANASINNGGDGSTRVNLRGLGSNRTLTLLNGRRVVAGGLGADAAVDLNSIPLAIVERVEVLKDGASAVYGSDAVGGVVNIITRSDYDGADATLYTSSTSRGDGFTYDASFVAGHNAANGKGNITFSAGIQSQDPVFASDRSFSKNDLDFDYVHRTASPRGSTAADGGHIDAFNIGTAPDGTPGHYNLCGADVQYCTGDGKGGFRAFDPGTDLYNYQPLNYLYTPSSRYNMFSEGSYKLAPSVTAFFEASYLNRTSDQQLAPTPFDTLSANIGLSKDSIYNPIGVDINGYDRRLEEFGPRRSLENIDTFRIVGGLRGRFSEDTPVIPDWKWELSYNYGRTNATLQSAGDLIVSRLKQAIGPSFRDDNNVPTCGTRDAPIPGCIPIDILGAAGSIDPAARSYVTFTGVSTGFNEQQTVLASANGQLVKLPNHGDLSVAVGADYRREAGGFTPDPLTVAGDTTSLSALPTLGSYNVVEGFGEASLVPISGHPIAQWVELDLAARGFRYDSFGSGVTWKAGGLVRTVEGIALRGTYSTAFRAPNVGELFAGRGSGFLPLEDPCDTRPRSMGGAVIALDPTTAAQCAKQGVPTNAAFGTSQQRAISGGNPALDAETAKVLTAGVVLEPPEVPGLALTLDYWRIDISHAIQGVAATSIFANCYGAGIQAYCDQIHRNPAQNYAIDYIDATTANVGSTATSGLDAAATYDVQLGGLGRLHTNFEGQYLFKLNVDDSTRVLHLRGNFDGGVNPTIKANLAAQWQHPSGAGLGTNVRYVGSFTECYQADCNDSLPSRDVGAWYKIDLFGSYAFRTPAGKTTLTVGVNNVLDRAPAVIYGGLQGDSDGATYDLLGRLVYARLAQQF